MTETVTGPGPEAGFDQPGHGFTEVEGLSQSIHDADEALVHAQGGPEVREAQVRLAEARTAGDEQELMAARNAVGDALLVERHKGRAHRGEATGFDEGDAYLLRAPGEDSVRSAQSQLRQALTNGGPEAISQAREQVYGAMAQEVEDAVHTPAKVPQALGDATPARPDPGKFGVSDRDPGLFHNPAGFGNPHSDYQREHNRHYKAERAAQAANPEDTWGDPAVDGEASQWRQEAEARLAADPETAVDPQALAADGDRLVAEAAAFTPPVHDSESVAKRQYDAAVAKVKEEDTPADPLELARPANEYPPGVKSTAQRQRFDKITNRHEPPAHDRRGWETVPGSRGRYRMAPVTVKEPDSDDQARVQQSVHDAFGDQAMPGADQASADRATHHALHALDPVKETGAHSHDGGSTQHTHSAPEGEGSVPSFDERQAAVLDQLSDIAQDQAQARPSSNFTPQHPDERPNDIVPGMRRPENAQPRPHFLKRMRDAIRGRRQRSH